VEAGLRVGARVVASALLLQVAPLAAVLALDLDAVRSAAGIDGDTASSPGVAARPRSVPSDKRRLHLVRTISGGLAPKSIVATPSGRVFAQNVTYLHTITVFDRRFKRIATISDSVRVRWLGAGRSSLRVQGAPVEAAVSVDGESIFVSQYSMYGPGFWSPGFDLCAEADAIDESYVYRIDVATLRKVRAYRVGEVPKFLAASPDGRHLLVANWCSMDVSVVDLRRGREVARIPIGLNPRGIAFSPDGSQAWVSVVGERRLAVIDMDRLRVRRTVDGIGIRPRHLVMSRNGRSLYVSLEGHEVAGLHDGSVLKLDPTTGAVLGRVDGLLEPRTMVLAPDGRSLYVVDYLAGRLVKIGTSSMRVLQSVPLGYHPIGVTYDAATSHVWVAGYGGSVWVLRDRARSTPDRRAS
jgi:YVTN family beta-propeller protein